MQAHKMFRFIEEQTARFIFLLKKFAAQCVKLNPCGQNLSVFKH